MTDLTGKTCVLAGIFIHKTNQAVKIRLSETAKPQDDFWIPMSQIVQIMEEDTGDATDWLNLDPNSMYLWRITGWIACKLFDCDGWEELVDLDLSFLDCE